MILIFGGTTEGKRCIELLDLIDEPYIYSTKTKLKKSHTKFSTNGTLDFSLMKNLCIEKKIDVIIDAAHPFAVVLHSTISKVSKELDIPTIRYEREFPKLDNLEGIKILKSYKELEEKLELPESRAKYKSILALTGVQTIKNFSEIQKNYKCYFRILNTDLSLKIALDTGLDKKYIVQTKPQIDNKDLTELIINTKANLLITKESGVSGFFNEKYEVAKALNIPFWIISRPKLSESTYTVTTTKKLLCVILKLHKTVLKLEDDVLRSGLTTGSSVCASAVAALTSLITKDIYTYSEINLPNGDLVKLPVFIENLNKQTASYIVIKNGGDDPDVTHGKEVGCTVEFSETKGINFFKGTGVGIVTLPGLQVKVGEPAINPVPRKMIVDSLTKILVKYNLDIGLKITPFVTDGEKIATKTFNPRIGIKGGISILGTTGRVMPYSSEAFINSIRQQVCVAAETQFSEIVATSGKRSENILSPFYSHLSELCFVHFGNFIGETIKICNELDISKLTIGIMTGKAAKLAEGHLDTHSKKVRFNSTFISNIVKECGYSNEIVEKIKTFKLANAIGDIIPFSKDEAYYQQILKRSYHTCKKEVNTNIKFKLILINSTGDTISYDEK